MADTIEDPDELRFRHTTDDELYQQYLKELNRVVDTCDNDEEFWRPGNLKLLADMERERLYRQLAKMGFLKR